jgi:hypothetical protein
MPNKDLSTTGAIINSWCVTEDGIGSNWFIAMSNIHSGEMSIVVLMEGELIRVPSILDGSGKCFTSTGAHPKCGWSSS